MLVTMKYPVRWTAVRGHSHRGKSLVMTFKQSYKTSLKRRREEVVPEQPLHAVSSPVPPAPRPPIDQEKEQPKKKMIKLAHPGTSRTGAQSPAPSPAPVGRQPSIAVAAPARPPPELERGDSIAVQNRPTVKIASAPQSAPGTPTPEPSRHVTSNSKAAKLSKKRKLADTEASPVPRRSRIVTMNYGHLAAHKKQQIARIFSSKARAMPPSDSIVATPVARAIPPTTSPARQGSSPANVDASVISSSTTISAGSSSNAQASQQQQKTPLPSGKIVRKPLPTGPSPHSAVSPTSGFATKPSANPRQPSQPHQPTSASTSRPVSPVASRSSTEPVSKPKKLVKLKLKLGNKSLTGLSKDKSTPPPPAGEQTQS